MLVEHEGPRILMRDSDSGLSLRALAYSSLAFVLLGSAWFQWFGSSSRLSQLLLYLGASFFAYLAWRRAKGRYLSLTEIHRGVSVTRIVRHEDEPEQIDTFAWQRCQGFTIEEQKDAEGQANHYLCLVLDDGKSLRLHQHSVPHRQQLEILHRDLMKKSA